MVLVLAGFLLSSALGSQVPRVECAEVLLDPPARDMCLGDQELRLAQSAPQGSPERLRHLEASADRYRRAADSTGDAKARVRALMNLADLYDAQQLDRPGEMESVLREVIPLAPGDLRPLYRLAKLAEDSGLVDEAETTLLTARHQASPNDIEPYRMLAQFYARRVAAIQQAAAKQEPPEPAAKPGEPDKNGVYQVGGGVTAPRRVDIPQYPTDAKDAGIQGAVVAEITVNESGMVTNARIVRSVPLLDDAALKAVREWRYEPTVVNGKPVPLTMTVTVNFALPRQ